MKYPQLRRPISRKQFERELAEACATAGVEDWSLDWPPSLAREHERNARRYAQMAHYSNGHILFEFAPQTCSLPWPQRLGLIAHEIGHAIDPDPAKTEDGADACGMAALDLLIVYDPRWPGKGLQTAIR